MNTFKHTADLAAVAHACFQEIDAKGLNGNVILMNFRREGDDHSLIWQFDSTEQARIAVAHAATYRAEVQFGGCGPRMFGEILSDAEELRIWLAFEYLHEAA